MRLGACIPDVPTHIITRVDKSNISYEIQEENLLLYPNPCTDIIKYDLTPFTQSTLSIYDISGSILGQRKIISNENEVDVSFLNPGAYIFQIANNKTKYTRTIIKK